MHAAADLFLGQFDEPAFDEIEPGGAGRREMHVIARPFREPATDERRLVRRVVVENQMDVEVARHGRVDRVEEAAEFARAMPRVTFADDAAGPHIERGKQRRRAMAHVVVRVPLGLPRPQRQDRRAAIERLNLRLLIDAQDQGAVRRMQIQPDDVADLLDEQRVLRQLEGLGPVRLQGERAPDAR